MMLQRTLPCLLLSLVAACAARQEPAWPGSSPSVRAAPADMRRQPIVQGLIGATFLENVTRTGGQDPGPPVQEPDLDTLPLIGGAWQHPLGHGKNLDYGLEIGFTLGWQGDVAVFSVGGGGLTVAIDNDLFAVDIFGGPFASLPLGKKLRLYGGLGPLMQFVSFDLKSSDTALWPSVDGSGFGWGWYARTGLEMAVSPETLVGLGVRWKSASVDLSSGLGDVDVDGVQAMVTVSRSF